MADSVEVLDIVNADDEVLGTYSRSEVYAHGLEYVRVVEALIQNSKGQFWIPIRLDSKKIAPGGMTSGWVVI
jgi:hypothetical protein